MKIWNIYRKVCIYHKLYLTWAWLEILTQARPPKEYIALELLVSLKREFSSQIKVKAGIELIESYKLGPTSISLLKAPEKTILLRIQSNKKDSIGCL